MSKLIKVLTLTLCLLAVVAAGALGGCQSNSAVSTTTDEFTLTDLWEKTMAATGVQEGTSQLESLWLEIDADGSIIVQSLYFRGLDASGQAKVYLVSTSASGKISWYTSAVAEVTTTSHPLSVFEAIDTLGIPDIPQGDDGCNLRISFEYGGAYYTDTNMALCLLSNGQLLPLESMSLNSDLPWAVITVSPMYITEEGTDENGNYYKRSSSEVDGQSMKQIWLLAADKSKATNIEYRED